VQIGRPGLFTLENQSETTHVESSLVPRLDEGSNPSNSTKVVCRSLICRRLLFYTYKTRKSVVFYG